MSADAKPLVLADLVSLKIDGPTIVFVRPREALPPETEHAVNRSLSEIAHHQSRSLGAPFEYLLVPHDFELMAVGNAELKKLGLARIEPSAAPKAPTPADELAPIGG